MKKVVFHQVSSAVLLAITMLASFQSCHSPTAASERPEKATIQIDTVTYNQVGTQADTLTLYFTAKGGWGLGLDTARADSLADWFARSRFKIEDMWFPASGPLCLKPYFTIDFIFVRLLQPDTLIDTLGFTPSSPPDFCFPTWTHYKFIWHSGA
ncbi:MAG: hypothetical protein KGJ59_01130 [Bacteroidota bacterium]|nr:hypothetical protein [Bacteroidota bacterium]